MVGDDMLKRFTQALALTLATAFMSFLAATLVFEGNLYYMAQLLAVFLVAYLVLAWFVHLKQDGFNPSLKDKVDIPEHMVGAGESDPFFSMIKKAEVVREDDPEFFWGKLLSVLLWSVVQIALLTVVLYHGFGIGAKYFL